ncbi:MAG: hypothetical protein HRU70_13370 [Phycisphaeraceae bacterium]|nr:MAG: hypothetical protein HRU70_13370 [Phycisphaeraceae bacterium]
MRRSAARWMAVSWAVLCPAGAWSQTGAVVLRGEGEVSAGEPLAVSEDGVRVATRRDAAGAVAGEVWIGWDRVREVRGPADLERAAEALRDVADAAWRAGSRAARGDFAAAEPLYEGLFERYRGRTGPTASAVSAGLLRCRLVRGAQASAVSAWLGWLSASVGGTPGVGELGGVIDAGTGLCPALPPMWMPSASVVSLAGGGVEAPGAGVADRSAWCRWLYVRAARAEVGLEDGESPMPELPKQAEDGVRLVYEVVRSRAGDEAGRREARRALGERLGGRSPGWVEAWVRVAVGRSLLLEPEVERKREGLLSLMYVVSRSSGEEGYITGLAMASAAVGLSETGEAEAGRALARELMARFPGHPSLDSAAVRALTGSGGSGTTGDTIK